MSSASKLKSTRWRVTDLLLIRAVSKKFDIPMDRIIRDGAMKEARRIVEESKKVIKLDDMIKHSARSAFDGAQ